MVRLGLALALVAMPAGWAAAQVTTSPPAQISPGPTSNPSSSPGLSGTAGVLTTSPQSAPPSSPAVPATPPSGAPPDVVVQPK